MAAVPAERERPRRREERAGSAKRRRREEPPQEPPEESPERPAETPRESPAEPGYLALARGLLAGSAPARRSPAPARPAGEPTGDGAGDGDDLLGQLIRDLNEINEVPFFDVQLPYELALKIFQYLGKAELGRCAQVSRTWKILAEDEVLWYRLCQQEGYLLDTSISDHSCWKLALKNCRAREHMLKTNWKNRVGAVSQLRYEPGRVLCDVHCCDGVVMAGYSSGEVRLWDTRTWDYTAPVLAAVAVPAGAGAPPHVSFVRINSSLAVAAYEDDVPGRPVAVAAAEDIVYLLKAEDPGKVLHSVYGQPVTCLDVAAHETAFGIKTFGWLLNEPNQILLYNLETNQCVTKVGNSMGDFSCVNLHSSPPNMLVAGNKDRRVRVFDLRSAQAVCSMYGHQLGVSAVQMDEWKIVSGGEEGLVCVWDQRMATKLWEMHSRYRGVIYSYEFSVDQLAVDSVLPICRSSYDEVTGYNYNIGLAVPYDSI
ncbi:F-box and WD repeat domain containing 8 [Turdus rufiventris]|nr:F-box and WD repeat domain containing 8 [Turdus rufiventris]